MKKAIALFLTLIMLMSLAACGGENSGPSEQTIPEVPSAATEPTSAEDTADPTEPTQETEAPTDPESEVDQNMGIDLEGVSTIEALEEQIDAYVTDSIASLAAQWEALSGQIGTYDKYCEEAGKVSDFYESVVMQTEQICVGLYDYSAAYARMILDSDMSCDDMYDAVDGINDCLYTDACDTVCDEIYDGILEEMNDHFYEGILEDAEDTVEYSAWYEVSSAEYSQWYEASSKVYELYYDTSSDIYSFYYDLSGELYSEDMERAEKVYEKFLDKTAKVKRTEAGASGSDAVFDTAVRAAGTTEELEAVVDAHVSECVQALYGEWTTLSAQIDTFDCYIENVDRIESFHEHITDATEQVLVLVCQYGVSYAEMILQSGESAKDQYKAFEDFKDCIYEDACETVKDEVYDGLLVELKDHYYDGIIKDAQDSIDYSDWSDARGDAYNWWSDARGEVYNDWTDIRGDLYNFFSDIRSELYSDDGDGATKELEKLKEKVAKMLSGDTVSTSSTEAPTEEATEAPIEEATESLTNAPEDDGSIDPEFQEAMDSYEAFFDEYVEIMKKYAENPLDLTILADYAEYMGKYADMMSDFDAWADEDLNAAETAYYLEVQNRINQKLLELA